MARRYISSNGSILTNGCETERKTKCKWIQFIPRRGQANRAALPGLLGCAWCQGQKTMWGDRLLQTIVENVFACLGRDASDDVPRFDRSVFVATRLSKAANLDPSDVYTRSDLGIVWRIWTMYAFHRGLQTDKRSNQCLRRVYSRQFHRPCRRGHQIAPWSSTWMCPTLSLQACPSWCLVHTWGRGQPKEMMSDCNRKQGDEISDSTRPKDNAMKG